MGLRYEPGASDSDTTGDNFFQASCDASLSVLAPVYISAANTVAIASANDVNKIEVLGFVKSKPTPTTCIVQTENELDGFSGLIPGTHYYLGIDGALLDNLADVHAANLNLVPLGVGYNTTTLFINIGHKPIYIKNY